MERFTFLLKKKKMLLYAGSLFFSMKWNLNLYPYSERELGKNKNKLIQILAITHVLICFVILFDRASETTASIMYQPSGKATMSQVKQKPRKERERLSPPQKRT